MKIPATDPLALAAIELARKALPQNDSKLAFIFKGDASLYTYDLFADGAVSIKAPEAGPGRINFSMAGYFTIAPIVSVKAKAGKVMAGPKAYPLPDSAKKTEAFTRLAGASVKAYRKKN